jgi:hypothetical protein
MRVSGLTLIITASLATSHAAHALHKETQLAVPAILGTSLSGLVLPASSIVMTESMVTQPRTCAFFVTTHVSLAEVPVLINARSAPRVSLEERLCVSPNARKENSSSMALVSLAILSV